MSAQIESYLEQKNQWLTEQVNVAYPTPQSLDGRDLYLKAEQTKQYIQTQYSQLATPKWVDDIVLVDFHRLTIMFAILQASQWSEHPEQEKLVIEFLTQIILSDDYQLYLGLLDGEPVAGAITRFDSQEKTLLVSDVTVSANNADKSQFFIADIAQFLQTAAQDIQTVIHPVD